MKRWGPVPLVVLVLVGLAILVIRHAVTPAVIAAAVERTATAWNGRPLRLTGTAEFRLLPWPRVHWSDATIADEAGTVVEAPAIDARLDLGDLVLGRIAVGEVVLSRPEIRIAVAPLADVLDRSIERLAGLVPARVVVESGRLRLVRPDGREELLEALDATLDWPRLGAAAEVDARFTRRGLSAAVRLDLPDPRRLAIGAVGATALRLDLPGLAAEYSGTGGLGRLEGRLAVDVTDPTRFAAWIGDDLGRLFTGPLRLGGRLAVGDRTATLSAARLALGDDRGEGVLSLRWDTPRPQLGATLAFSGVDLTAKGRPVFGPGWPDLALGRDRPALDLDLRLSVTEIVLPSVTISRIAAALHLAEGRLDAEIGSAEVWGVPVTAEMRGELGATGLASRLRIAAPDLPLVDLAGILGLDGVTAGRGDLTLDGALICTRLGDCPGAVDARLDVALRRLGVTGPSPFADGSRFHPIVVVPGTTPKATSWPKAEAVLHLAGTKLRAERIEAEGQDIRLVLEGSGDLATGVVDLTGNAQFPAFRADGARAGDGGIAIPIRVGGTFQRLETTARTIDPAPQ